MNHASLRFGLALLLPLTVLVGAGCVKDDPVVTGNRDASVDAPVAVEVKPGADPDEDAADCERCAETMSTERPTGTLCRKNGPPSSARRRSAFVDCVCYDRCVEACGAFCAGTPQDKICDACVATSCPSERDACVADKRP